MNSLKEDYPDVSRDQAVVRHAQDVLAKHARSFRLASLFLPKEKANDAAVVYSFCRLVDDAVDGISFSRNDDHSVFNFPFGIDRVGEVCFPSIKAFSVE